MTRRRAPVARPRQRGAVARAGANDALAGGV